MSLLTVGLLCGLAGAAVGALIVRVMSSSTELRTPIPLDEEQSSLAVVTQDEWLHLCARRRIRLNRYRVVSCAKGDESLYEAFSRAPFTKPGDGSALVVLTLRPLWLNECAQHPDSSAVGVLELSDVLSHHLVSDHDKSYLASRAASAGVKIDRRDHGRKWIEWDSAESDADAQHTAGALAVHLGHEATDPGEWPTVRSAWFSRAIQPRPNATSIVERLVASVGDLNEAALENRDSAAYFLQVAIEWAERHGCEPRAPGALGEELRSIYDALKHISWDNLEDFGDLLAGVSSRLAKECPAAFTSEVSPITVGIVTRIICDGGDDQLSPERLATYLNFTPLSSIPLVALVTVHALTVEKVNQFISSST